MGDVEAASLKCVVCGDPATHNHNQGFYCDDCYENIVPLNFTG